MTYPTILYVWSEMRAAVLQRDHNEGDVLVLPVFTYGAHRAYAVIVEPPRREQLQSESVRKAYDEWCKWVPTRIVPGCGKGVTFL
jgi:hypothetical protein